MFTFKIERSFSKFVTTLLLMALQKEKISRNCHNTRADALMHHVD